jgi:cytochrome o ubiquinol oxidase subunit 1
MPKNTPLALYIGVLSFVFGFAVVWYIFWLAGLSLIGVIVCIFLRLWDRHTETFLSPDEIAKIEKEARAPCQS